MNEKDNSTNAATCKTTTETAVNYPIQIIFLHLICGYGKIKVDGNVLYVGWMFKLLNYLQLFN